MKTIVKPIMYHPLERHWYRLVDFVQPKWLAFAGSRTGRVMLWLLPRLTRLVIRVAYVMAVAMFVIGTSVMYVCFAFCLGRGRLGRTLSR